jgi:hypothetical protein
MNPNSSSSSLRRNTSLTLVRNSRNVLLLSQSAASATTSNTNASTSNSNSSNNLNSNNQQNPIRASARRFTTVVPYSIAGGLGSATDQQQQQLNINRTSPRAGPPTYKSLFWIPHGKSSLSRNLHAIDVDGPPRYYLIGTRIDCRVTGWSRQYPGRVAAVNNDGTLLVSFDDGDYRDCIPLGNVTLNEPRSSATDSAMRAPLYLQAQVEVIYESKWCLGRISEIIVDRYTCVLCDNGRTLNDLTRDQIRCYVPLSKNLSPGELVEVLQEETRAWVKGHVDDMGMKILFKEESEITECLPEEIIIRYPIVNPQRTQEEEDTSDAAPMILSMQERLR